MSTPLHTAVPERRYIARRASEGFAQLLYDNKLSLFVSTYQAGVIASIWAETPETFNVLYSAVPKPMGMATSRDALAIAEEDGVSIYRRADNQSVDGIEGAFDTLFTPRLSYITGQVDAHDVAWTGDQVVIVNTRYSALARLDGKVNFSPFWQPHFISGDHARDKCHLNGLAMKDGKPAFVTALGESNIGEGWRGTMADGGILINCRTNEIVVRGLSMPHSPRFQGEDLIYLNSGKGEVCRYTSDGRNEIVADNLPGFARGMQIAGNFAFIAVSRAREALSFAKLPIAHRGDTLLCGVVVIDLRDGRTVSFFEFTKGIDELFEVIAVPFRKACVLGRATSLDGLRRTWVTPHGIFSAPGKVDLKTPPTTGAFTAT